MTPLFTLLFRSDLKGDGDISRETLLCHGYVLFPCAKASYETRFVGSLAGDTELQFVEGSLAWILVMIHPQIILITTTSGDKTGKTQIIVDTLSD